MRDSFRELTLPNVTNTVLVRTCLRKPLSVLGRPVDLLAPKTVASTTHALETVHVHWKLYIERQSSEVRLKVKISIMK